MIRIEVTDTLNGRPSYCQLQSYKINESHRKYAPAHIKRRPISDLAIVRRAKAIAGWTNVSCSKVEILDMIRLIPHDRDEVMVITFN